MRYTEDLMRYTEESPFFNDVFTTIYVTENLRNNFQCGFQSQRP